jgi:hypothetical protein
MKGIAVQPRLVLFPKKTPTPSSEPSTTPTTTKKTAKKAKFIVPLVIILVILAVVGGVGFIAYSTGMKVKASLESAKTHALAAYAGLKTQNLDIAKTELDQAKNEIGTAQSTYSTLKWLQFTPLAWHYKDGNHAFAAVTAGIEAGQTVIAAIEPYADVIGFKGQGSFVGGTAEDRIVKIIETVDKINPSLDTVTAKLTTVTQELNAINPKRYPWITIQGQSVASLIATAQSKIAEGNAVLSEFRPAISVLPQIAGLNESKKYLVLFQNDAELRPTGGFMTAYAVLKIDKGKITPEKSSDIYDLDDKFKKKIDPPAIVKKLLKVSTWHLRDMNLSPDFKESMNQFVTYYNELPGESKVDGVITVDTQVLSELVKVLGPIEVPGFGTFSAENDARCNCPQVIYTLEEIADRPTYTIKTDRKAILGPMMQTILVKAYGAPKQVWPSLFTTIWNSINQKHMLMYFFNEDFQNAVENVNVAGRIKTYDGDYLHINDSNFGGAKSNMYVTQTVDQEVVKEGNYYTKTITISYKNPRKGDNCNLEAGKLCLNGKMPNWTRIYLPKDAEVGEVLGFDNDTVKQSEDLGKKVVEGYFELNPESQVKIKLTVKVPVKTADYRLFIQKQPGTKNSDYTVKLNGAEQAFELATDKEIVMQ